MSVAALLSRINRLKATAAKSRPKPTAKTAEVRTRAVDVQRWANDFEGFAGLLDIITKDGPTTKLRPNAIQAAFEVTRCGRDIVLKPRQVGLTTWELARDLWFFLTRPGSQVVVVCQSDKDDSAVKGNAEKVSRMFASLRAAGIDIEFRSHSTTHWVNGGNGSTLSIVGAGASEKAAQKKGRSGTIHRLHITECAFFEHAKTTMNALLECVPPPEFGTEITIESTANGAAGFFFEFYRDAKSGKKPSWRSHFYPWHEQAEYVRPLAAGETITPEGDREQELVRRHKITDEQLAWYRAKVADKGDADLVDQEYPTDEETCWITPGRTFFSKERTKKLLSESVDPLRLQEIAKDGAQGVLAVWAEPDPGVEYAVVVDPSEGVGGDPGAAVVYRRDGKHVATLHGQFTTWAMGAVLAEVGFLFNTATMVVERNNHGHAVLDALEHLPPAAEGGSVRAYPKVWTDDDGRPGWKNTATSRSAALDALEGSHRKGDWSTPDRGSLDEFMLFVVLKGKPQAGPGAHDDRLIAHAIAHAVLSKTMSIVEYDASYDDDLPSLRV